MPLTALLSALEAASTEASPEVLDEARSYLDSLSLEETVEAIEVLLDWSQAPRAMLNALCERCRLVSYAAIMHGCALLPYLPSIARIHA